MSSKTLVIVESPAKAKTINKYLGNEYIVRSSVGHIRDLPRGVSTTKGKGGSKPPEVVDKTKAKFRALVRRMGIDPENNWAAEYQIMEDKWKVVKELIEIAKRCDTVILATDHDREGEAIAWHIREVIGGDPSRYQRVVFNEITKPAILKAFANPGQLDMAQVNAQQARRFLDRLVGFMISPLLWEKIARNLSAGRVQSVAVRVVVEREREIRKFIPDEFWQMFANVIGNKSSKAFKLDAVSVSGKKFDVKTEQEMNVIKNGLKGAEYIVNSVDSKKTTSNPSAPFITSTLQQAASTKLGFGVKKTMTMAQRLYEAGHITYMRTDSTFISVDAMQSVRAYVHQTYGDKYLCPYVRTYSNNKNAQEAHEAIRPSNVTTHSKHLSGLDADAIRLYDLIWRQYVATQMTTAEYLSTVFSVSARNVDFKAKGRVVVFDGYTKVMPHKPNADEAELPQVSVGEKLKLIELETKQCFTKPPSRYSEASLVKILEEKGIGRPSTYAAIITTIQERGYVKIENKRLHALKMGDIVTERLMGSFPNLMDYQFTANLEKQLDMVAHGSENWIAVLDAFYLDLSDKLKVASGVDGMRKNSPVTIDCVACTACQRPMQVRTASTGVFLGCSGYTLTNVNQCKKTMPLELDTSFVNLENEEAETKTLMLKRRCSICSSVMDAYVLDKTRKLHICSNSPECVGVELEHGTFAIKAYTGPQATCDKCETGMLELVKGRFGLYYKCNTCDNTRKAKRDGSVAPPRLVNIHMTDLLTSNGKDHYILRDGGNGLFLAASTYPKIKEIRSPKVSELISVKDQLPEKYRYLADAPISDPDGNPAIIRTSRKTGDVFITSEVDGKPTKWTSSFQNGVWKK